tara:strand:- start:130 stop:504 length:375 start_codon:yes stop_codon:yes gene_type:complete
MLETNLKMQQPQKQNVPPHIDAIFREYIGSRNLAIADMQVYLRVPVGVGEHSNIGDEIKKKLELIDHYDSLLQTIMGLYPDLTDSAEKTEQTNPAPPTKEVGQPTDLYEDGKLIGKFKDQNSKE